jgi:hypothetical protein
MGSTSCDQSAAVTAAAIQACGGGAGSYQCLCNSGFDTSELLGTNPPLGSGSTAAPTNNGTNVKVVDILKVLCVAVLFVLIVM